MSARRQFKPFVGWTMNDHITRAGAARQLRSFAACGYGGVMIMPWGGLPYAFMSHAWLEGVAWILDEAEKLDMGVWIWDEWLYPSGFAGGLLGREDRHKSKKLKVCVDLVLEPGETAEVPVPSRFLAAGVFTINKYNNPVGPVKRLLPARDGVIRHRSVQRSRLVLAGWDFISKVCHTTRSYDPMRLKKNVDIYTNDDMHAWSADMLNPETTREYLRLIHERYWRRLKPHFGKALQGFFYDEPSLPTIFPWTPGLERIFLARKGYDLLPFLAPLLAQRTNMGYDAFGDPGDLIKDEKLKQVLSDFHDVWTSLMAENFYGVIQQWCHKHGVLSIGHQVSDETLRKLLNSCGTYFKNMDQPDMPGTDVVSKQVTLGRFDDFPRLAGSRAAVAGKPFALSESFACTGHGVYIDQMRFLAEHQIIRGINRFVAQIAGYNPKKSWFFCPPELNPSHNPMIRRYGILLNERMTKLSALMSRGTACLKTALYVPLQNYYRHAPQITDEIDALARRLTYHQREYDYIWDQDLSAMTVQAGSLVSAGEQVYGEILIPPGARCVPEVLRVLQNLKRQGARVVVVAPAEDSLRKLTAVICAAEEVLGQLHPADCPLNFAPGGLPISGRSRRLDDQTWVTFLLNESKETQTLTLQIQPGWALWEEDLNTRQIYGIKTGSRLAFCPGESRLVFVGKTAVRPSAPRAMPQAGRELPLTDWQLNLPNGKRIQLKNRLPSWHELGHGAYSGFMRYTAGFRWDGAAPSALLDLGEVRYAATVWLDGKRVGDVVFTPFRVLLSGLTKGRHTLRVDVLNTLANSICGTEERYRQLERKGAFIGTYAPIYLPLNRQKISSGLLGPVMLQPVKQEIRHGQPRPINKTSGVTIEKSDSGLHPNGLCRIKTK